MVHGSHILPLSVISSQIIFTLITTSDYKEFIIITQWFTNETSEPLFRSFAIKSERERIFKLNSQSPNNIQNSILFYYILETNNNYAGPFFSTERNFWIPLNVNFNKLKFLSLSRFLIKTIIINVIQGGFTKSI